MPSTGTEQRSDLPKATEATSIKAPIRTQDLMTAKHRARLLHQAPRLAGAFTKSSVPLSKGYY